MMKNIPNYSSSEIVAMRPLAERPAPGRQPLDVLCEIEACDKLGRVANVLTVMLRGSECAFRCLMCDLWKYTHVSRTTSGAVAAQVREALASGPEDPDSQHQPWVKLYNASNFFSPTNVPREDLQSIAQSVSGFSRVIVENHPRLLPDSIVEFRDEISGRLEVAMGLETAHPETLASLNKQLCLEDFRHACEWLLARDIDIRTFVLLRPPGMDEAEGIEWCIRSVEFSHALGVRHISIIPVRSGNGVIERLAAQGLFEPPQAKSLEQTLLAVIDLPNAIITADLWNWQQLAGINEAGGRDFYERIEHLNLTQTRRKA
jgi:archaeosine synthase beta-subunit